MTAIYFLKKKKLILVLTPGYRVYMEIVCKLLNFARIRFRNELNNIISFIAPDWLKTKGSERGKCICFLFLGSDLLKTKGVYHWFNPYYLCNTSLSANAFKCLIYLEHIKRKL